MTSNKVTSNVDLTSSESIALHREVEMGVVRRIMCRYLGFFDSPSSLSGRSCRTVREFLA